jgi:hypothetical protein
LMIDAHGAALPALVFVKILRTRESPIRALASRTLVAMESFVVTVNRTTFPSTRLVVSEAPWSPVWRTCNATVD